MGLSTEFAVIGAGPAGAHIAARLAAAGRDVALFDPKGAWEKPCGGGVPTRAIREFAYLLHNSGYPYRLVHRITLISPLERWVSVCLDEPFAVYSRKVLNGLVLDRAIESRARFERTAIVRFSRDGDAWNLWTSTGDRWQARFLIGADGAASATRRKLVGIFSKRDLALAFGYNIEDATPEAKGSADMSPGTPDEVIIRFPKDFTGYLWAFPRSGAMNFGVAAKLGERTSDELRGLLSNFVRDYYGGEMPDSARTSFFGAKIPTLDVATWSGLRATGEGWALVGDAAGFCDPITGEGIYYAFKSADILADSLVSAARSDTAYAQATDFYERRWREAFGNDLRSASSRLPRFYRGYFLGHIFTDAMVFLARYHRGVREVLGRMLTGDQSYLTAKGALLRGALKVF
jgi:flavin-dependent dehydrogenase